jgi:hypothetical protein
MVGESITYKAACPRFFAVDIHPAVPAGSGVFIDDGTGLVLAGEHLISQRQTFGRHDQGNDDLHTIRPVIARVAEAPLVAFRERRILEVGARQIEQHVVADVEQIAPSSHQMIEDRLLVRQQPVKRVPARRASGPARACRETQDSRP